MNCGGVACFDQTVKCKGCGERIDYTDCMHQFKGDAFRTETEYCPYCRENCDYCGDWMKGEEETELMGKRVHERCYYEAKTEVA